MLVFDSRVGYCSMKTDKESQMNPQSMGKLVHCDPYNVPPMKQQPFASLRCSYKKKQTRGERFLAEMEESEPWARSQPVTSLYRPKIGQRRARQVRLCWTFNDKGMPKDSRCLGLSGRQKKRDCQRSSIGVQSGVSVSHQFDHTKVRYRGLAKNSPQVMVLKGLASPDFGEEVINGFIRPKFA